MCLKNIIFYIIKLIKFIVLVKIRYFFEFKLESKYLM